MREIKFRAWDGRKGVDRWYESVNPPLQWKDGFDRPRPYVAFTTVPEGVVLLQFTGLHDKNGKEIYEGDILLGDAQRRWVAWNDGGEWSVCTKSDNGHSLRHLGTFLYDFDVEVIGNTYENPELIESK